MSSESTILQLAESIRPSRLLAHEQFEFPAEGIQTVADVEAKLMSDSGREHDSRIWVCAHSVTDCFFYLHVRKGLTVRAMVLAETEDALWERVEGAPEPWEKSAFENETGFDSDDVEIVFGQHGRWPMPGDIATAADAMKYANAALDYWTNFSS